MSEEKYGRIVQIIGPVIDVAFDDESQLPNLLDALEIERANGEKLITEVQQDIGENTMEVEKPKEPAPAQQPGTTPAPEGQQPAPAPAAK